LTEIWLYCEGHKLLRPGFEAFLSVLRRRAREKRCKFRVIPSGSGSTACRDFGTAIRENPRVWSILLIDSEGPLRANASASLCREQGWSESNAGSIFWMVEMMEAWFHADKDALADFYRSGFQRNSLKSNPNVEQISKKDLQHGLSAATKNSQKGDYYDNKTTHGTKLLASIDADLVRKSAPNCHDLFQTVLAKLAQ
jgi:hypothetical protein